MCDSSLNHPKEKKNSNFKQKGRQRANYRRVTSNSEDSGDVENLQTGAYTESMDLVLKTESSDLTL